MKSMTGFGKAVFETPDFQVEVEIKSVNHRFLDIQLRSPKQVNEFEQAIRQTIKNSLQRGRVDVFLTLRKIGQESKKVVLQWELIESLVKEMQMQAQQRFGTELPVAPLLERLVMNEALMTIEEQSMDEEALKYAVLQAVQQAVQANDASRQLEGQGIKAILEENHQALLKRLEDVSLFIATHEQEYQQRFEQKLTDYLGAEIEKERLLTEMAILLERGDVHEEIDRLNLHLDAMAKMLGAKKSIGRELDFLIQEMNREINTIGSKSSPIEIKNAVVQMKTIVEKIREQVQNVE